MADTVQSLEGLATLKPAAAPDSLETLNGRKWKPAVTQIAVKMMRMPSMSQKLPTLSWPAREWPADFEAGVSEAETDEGRLGILVGLCIDTPL